MPIRLALVALVLLVAGSEPVAAPPVPTTLIRGARVFDGSGHSAEVRDVLIRGDRIAAVGRHIATRADTVVEAAGMTLLPGLNDLHVHSRGKSFADPAAFAASYNAYLRRGITGVNEFSIPRDAIARVRGFAAGTPSPRLRLAVRFGVPDGHGTETPWTEALTATVSTPTEARAAMADALRYRPDLVKIFVDGWRYGRAADLADMDAPTLEALVDAAHDAHLPVLTHTVTLDGLKRAARAGVDAVAHGVGDAPLDGEAIRLMRRHRTGYIPTLSAYEPLATRALTAEEVRDLPPGGRATVGAAVPEYEARRWAIMGDNLRRVLAAGIRVGVGTDAGVTGVYAGWATLHEMRLMEGLGMSPVRVLRAATRDSAAIVRDGRRGRIRRGAIADLVLVGGRPDERLADLHDVRAVFVGGRQVSAGER